MHLHHRGKGSGQIKSVRRHVRKAATKKEAKTSGLCVDTEKGRCWACKRRVEQYLVECQKCRCIVFGKKGQKLDRKGKSR